jgi:alanine-glyoxylate transaminase/serine-glyoxylate transaminase/serine-pyruvate transaminase
MSLLPEIDRILLGPGPSLTAPRVMRAMAAPTVSHLDPLMMALLDDVRARLGRVYRAAEGSFAFAVSGTGTSGMETAVANLVRAAPAPRWSSPQRRAPAERCAVLPGRR